MRIVKKILFWLAVVFLILAIAAVAVPKIFGVEFRAVLTGSMEPEIPVGSLVVIVPTKAEDIQIGDDITFVSESDKVVTHRVIEIDRDENTFTTYGIANGISNKDAPSRYENIIGVVRYHAPVIGKAFSWFATTTGKIISITVIVAIFLISELLSLLFSGKSKKKTAVEAEVPLEEEMPVRRKNEMSDLAKALLNGQAAGKTEKTEKMEKTGKTNKVGKTEKNTKVRPENTDEFWNGEDRK